MEKKYGAKQMNTHPYAKNFGIDGPNGKPVWGKAAEVVWKSTCTAHGEKKPKNRVRAPRRGGGRGRRGRPAPVRKPPPSVRKPPPRNSGKPHFLGCYKDNRARDLKYGPKRFGYNVRTCHAACPRFKFYALQAGSQCFCDNSFGSPSAIYPKVPTGQCGANRHGGGWRNAVYTNSQSAAASERKTKAHKRNQRPHYIGCYRDNGSRALKHGPRRFGYSVASCHAACPRYKYFALQAGSQCFCDNRLRSPTRQYPKVPDPQCGKSEHGGAWRNAVYATPAVHGVPARPPQRPAQRRRRWFRI